MSLFTRAVGARVVGGAAVGAHVGRHDAAFHDAHLSMSLFTRQRHWPVGNEPPALAVILMRFPNGVNIYKGKGAELPPPKWGFCNMYKNF